MRKGEGADSILDYFWEWFMYSYEDRTHAVQLYFKLGRRLRLMLRKLGYPDADDLEERFVHGMILRSRFNGRYGSRLQAIDHFSKCNGSLLVIAHLCSGGLLSAAGVAA